MKSLNAILPRLILYLAIVMIAAGIIMRGVGLAEFQRIWDNLLARPAGSLAFRFLLQPAMSTIFAVRDGIKDARGGRAPYFSTVLSNPNERLARLREGIAVTGKIILLGILIDGVYQAIEFKTFFPVEALKVAMLLAFIPYLLIRGPVTRITRRLRRHPAAGETQ
jgi:hypothetical protein